jgi:hypothetical protein
MLLLWSSTPIQAFNGGGENFTRGPIVYNDWEDELLLFWFMFLQGV